MSGTINWTGDGRTGISSDGWMITRQSSGWNVFDADDNWVGKFDTRDEATTAVRVGQAV